MFNWVAQIDTATTRNIRDIMSRSKKKTPASTCCCCKSQKRGKQFCNRKFRRRERMMIGKGQYDRLPNKPIEVTDPWDLGGDGKTFWGFSPDEDWFIRLMRKWIVSFGGKFFFFAKHLRDGKMFVILQCQIVVRGREQIAFAAIFKLDLSDPHTRT